MRMVKISCLCPTYNRAPHQLVLLEEAIESFLRQDYEDSELVILNDTPGQTLFFEHPRVRIVNTPFRCASLGEKRNLLVALAQGELICVWDDDDISLPWRLSKSLEMLGDADYYNPEIYWQLHHDGLRHDSPMGWCYNASIYRKSTYEELDGTPNVSLGEDYQMDRKLRTRNVAQHPPLPIHDWYYIYRWGFSSVHLSESATDTLWNELGQKPIVQGQFRITPRWLMDYPALTAAHALKVSGSRLG
jgi:glycosyltransferase involved in cell wall biosynthesis